MFGQQLRKCDSLYTLIYNSGKYVILLLSFAYLLSLLSCKKAKQEPNLADAILSVKETGQLVTAEYTLTKIVKANDNRTWYKIGDRKILMSCEAYLKAGVNLQTITQNNFTLSDSILTVTLPHAQFFSLNIPPDKIKMEYQDISVFREGFSAAEREQLLAQAEVQIKNLVNSLGILKTAETNAEVYVRSLLQESGFKNVNVLFQ